MTLTRTQTAVLSAALARPDRRLEPLPKTLIGGAAKKVVDALIARGLVEAGLDGPVATEAAAEALNGAKAGEEVSETADAAGEPETPKTPRTPREGTKQARVIALLRRGQGATIDEMRAETGWAPHTVRGALAGALKKRLGLDVRSEATEDRGRVYRIIG
ncbi:MAG: DUF3489 domain-containing protein [Pseudomonadota bacterium]